MDVIYKLPKENGGASAEGCVRYDQEQTLTDEQQQQAKDNLGIEDPEPQAAVLYDQEQSLTDEQQQQACENIGAAQVIYIELENSIEEMTNAQFNEIINSFFIGRKDKKFIIRVSNGARALCYPVLHAVVGSATQNQELYLLKEPGIFIKIYRSGFNLRFTEKNTYPYNQTITIKQGGVTKGSFTLNQSSAATINLDAGGVQADWNETDTDDPAYINNKPTIPEVPAMMTSVTWAQLKALRDGGTLTPGAWYRITDYQASTSQEGTSTDPSAGVLFDIAVLATGTGTLSEQAKAVAHAGSTLPEQCRPEAWKLSYCLDNDSLRFAWAQHGTFSLSVASVFGPFGGEYTRDPASDFGKLMAWKSEDDGARTVWTSKPDFTPGDLVYELHGGELEEAAVNTAERLTPEGKGVIFRLADERGNDCPYDFKAIRFRRTVDADGKYSTEAGATEEWVYTFNALREDGMVDASAIHEDPDADEPPFLMHNVVEPFFIGERQRLNDNVFLTGGNDNIRFYGNTLKKCSYLNTFASGCFMNTIGEYCSDNVFGENCYNNTLHAYSDTNTLADDCNSNLLMECSGNCNLGEGNVGISIEAYSSYITTGDNCRHITFGKDCCEIEFGDYHASARIGDGVHCVRHLSAGDEQDPFDNFTVLAGVHGTSSEPAILDLSNDHEAQVVGQTQDGEVLTWYPAEETGGGEHVQSDWNETDTDDPAYIKNKPTIPTANNPAITIKQGGTTKGSFTLNQSGAATINLDAGGEPVQSDWNETDTDDPAYINNKPTIPTVNDPYIIIRQGGVNKDRFSLNQATEKTIDLDAGGVQADWNETDTDDPAYINNKPTIPTVNDPLVTIKQDGVTKGTFSLNQSGAASIDLIGSTSIIMLDVLGIIEDGSTSVTHAEMGWDDMGGYGLSRSAYLALPQACIISCNLKGTGTEDFAPLLVRKEPDVAQEGKAFAMALVLSGDNTYSLIRYAIGFLQDIVVVDRIEIPIGSPI